MGNSDETFRAYFLGELTEEESAHLENEFLGDDAKFALLQAAENDLLDDYTNNRLSPTQAKLFEKNYLNSPFRQNRLDFSKTLLNYFQNESEPVQVVKDTQFAWARAFSFWKIGVAFAGLILLLSSGLWLIAKLNQTPKNEIVSGNAPELQSVITPTVSPQATPMISPTPTVEKTPDKQANKQVSPTPTPKNPAPPTPTIEKTPTAPKPNQTVVLALSTGGLRDGGKIPQITIGKDTKNVVLRLNLGETPAKRFEVNIQNSDGTTVFQTKNARLNGKNLNVSLPANLLKNDDYTVEVFVVKTNAETEKTANFNFRVLPK